MDIQILAMMLDGQASSEDRAFTRKAYQKFGGIEGLLQRFLKEQLDTPTIHNRDQAALKVLLALTDLDQNVRAGTLGLKQLQEKLQGIVAPDRVSGILEWLCSVRIVTKITQEDQPDTYELAHERLIIPLRNVAGKTLTYIDNLSHLLDRRVNEWIGNQRQKRYLFNLKELWKIQKYSNLLTWEPKREQKEALLKASWNTWKGRSAYLFSTMALLAVFILLLNTPYFLIRQIQYIHFLKSLEKANFNEKQEAAALLIATYPDLAIKTIKTIAQKEDVLQVIIVALDSLRSDSIQYAVRAKELLDLGIIYANTFRDAHFQSFALSSLAKAAGELGEIALAKNYLENGEAIAKTIKDADSQVYALISLAKVAGELGEIALAKNYLVSGKAIAKTIKDTDSQVYALSRLARAAGELGEIASAKTYLESGKAIAENINYNDADSWVYANLLKRNFWEFEFPLSSLAQAAGEIAIQTKQAIYLENGEAIAKTIKNTDSQVYTLSRLAEVAGEIGEIALAKNYLENGWVIAKTIKDADSQASALRSLAQAAGEIAIQTKQAVYLENGEAIAEKIDDVDSRTYALIRLAEVAVEIGEIALAKNYLKSSEAIAKTIKDADSQASTLRRLVEVAGRIAIQTMQAVYLENGEAIAEKIDDVDSQASALRSLGVAATKLHLWRRAYQLANKMSEHQRIIGYAYILREWENRHSSKSEVESKKLE